MPARVSCSWLIAACLVLGGCAELPQQPQLPQQPAVPAKPNLIASMARHHTADPDEIRRRWGDYALLMGEAFVGTNNNPVEINEYKWQVSGALARVDYLSCHESTRKCDEGWFRVQYDPDHKRLNFLDSNDHPWAHAAVQPDGSVHAVRTAGGDFTMRFDYDKDEGIFLFPNLTTRYVPTERKQFAEIRTQWKEVDAQTREHERVAAAQTYQPARATPELDRGDWSEAQRSPNIAGAINAFTQSYNSSMQGYRQQQAQSMERIARAAETQRAAEAQRAASAPQPRRDLPRTNPEALRAPAASQPAPGPSQQKQALAPAAQPQATTPAKSSGSNKPKSEQVATASRGQARAWCMRKNSSEFECLGPFQKGWGTLKRALEMSGCSNGSGYTPTLGTGGQSFNCGRELHSYEKAVPTYDPFRTR